MEKTSSYPISILFKGGGREARKRLERNKDYHCKLDNKNGRQGLKVFFKYNLTNTESKQWKDLKILLNINHL